MKFLPFFLILIIMFSACQEDQIEERHVCETTRDCRDGYECLFTLDNDKNYGKCTKEVTCLTDEDCPGRVCNQDSLICVSNGKLLILSSTLPDGELNTDYETQIEYSGVVEEHFYIEAIDPLPDGLTISKTGLISGTPEKIGNFIFKVRIYAHSEDDTIYYEREYAEKFLQINILFTPCDPNPCEEEHKTVCVEDSGSEDGYICNCDQDYILHNGICVIDPCDPNPCTEDNKTVCTQNDDYTDYSCSCDEGFYDHNGVCKEDFCLNTPCTEDHKTVCTNGDEGAICSCDDGYIENENSECIYDYCADMPCTEPNRGVCRLDSEEDLGYRCDCNRNYFLHDGNCVMDLCQNNPCDDIDHRTVCVPSEDYTTFECFCEEGFVLQEDGSCMLPGDTCDSPITLEPGIQLTGDTSIMYNDYTANDCARGAASKDMVYTFTIEEQSVVSVLMESQETGVKTALHLRSTCDDISTQIACNDVYDDLIEKAKIDKVLLEAGTYYVIADGYRDYSEGPFTIELTVDSPCNPDENSCQYGYYCDPEYGVCLENLCISGGVENICGGVGNCDRSTGLCECNEGYLLDEENNICVDDPCDPDPCDEGSQCVVDDFEGNFHCGCLDGYLETLDGSCIQNPCDPNSCTDENKTLCSYEIGESDITYSCSCDDGYILDEDGITCINPCDPNPCTDPHKTVCSFNGVFTTCSCDEGYVSDGEGGCYITQMSICPGAPIAMGQTVYGDTSTASSNYYASCASSSQSNDVVYTFTITRSHKVTIFLRRDDGESYDTALHLRKGSCTPKGSCSSDDDCATDEKCVGPYGDKECVSEVACDDDESGTSSSAIKDEILEPGTYFIFADGYSTSNNGSFSLSLTGGPICESDNDCDGDNEVCNLGDGNCECESGYQYGTDGLCHPECLEENVCADSLNECIDGLCYRRTYCEPSCGSHSSCNLETLTCVCDEGYSFDQNGNCVWDLCIQNSVNCGNFAQCIPATGECICEAGYINYIEGIGCEDDLNPCTPVNPCTEENRSVCDPKSEVNFSCLCDNGYIENSEKVCIDDPCDPDPCGENSYCEINEQYNSVCLCDMGYRFDHNGFCQLIEGNSCNEALPLYFNQTLTGELTEDMESNFLTSCNNSSGKEYIYFFELSSSTQFSATLTEDGFNGTISIFTDCYPENGDLLCNSSSISSTLEAGFYYLVVKGETENDLGSFQIEITAIEGLSVESNLKDGVIERNYLESIIVKGGEAPYNITVSNGSNLPEGLNLVDGVITGIPTSAGEYQFNITVIDNNSTEINKTINLNIVDNSTPLIPEVGDIVINEILYTPISDINLDNIYHTSMDEFVEIINNSYKTLDISNMILGDTISPNRHEFTGIFEPGEVIVIFGGGSVTNISQPNVTFVTASSGRLSLNDSGDSVILKVNSTILEQVDYTGGLNGESINREIDIEGSIFVPHTEVSNDEEIINSAGLKADLSEF